MIDTIVMTFAYAGPVLFWGGFVFLIYYAIKGKKVHDEHPSLFGRPPAQEATPLIPSTRHTGLNGMTHCTHHNKVIHATQQSAESQAGNFAQTYGGYRRVYREPACGSWHVTSQRQRHW